MTTPPPILNDEAKHDIRMLADLVAGMDDDFSHSQMLEITAVVQAFIEDTFGAVGNSYFKHYLGPFLVKGDPS